MDEEKFRWLLNETRFVVNATSDEVQMLWEKFSTETIHKTPLSVYRWDQLNPGRVIDLGKLAGMPVCMSVRWFRINGILVMFYEGISQVVDSRMMDKWIEENVSCKDQDGRPAKCNPANIHHALNYIKKFGS